MEKNQICYEGGTDPGQFSKLLLSSSLCQPVRPVCLVNYFRNSPNNSGRNKQEFAMSGENVHLEYERSGETLVAQEM